jgi:hypothetical protein
MLIPLCGRSIAAICGWFQPTKNNCGDPSPRQVRTQDDARLQIAIAGSKEFFFLNELSWNVVENKGPSRKAFEQSWNLDENKCT